MWVMLTWLVLYFRFYVREKNNRKRNRKVHELKLAKKNEKRTENICVFALDTRNMCTAPRKWATIHFDRSKHIVHFLDASCIHINMFLANFFFSLFFFSQWLISLKKIDKVFVHKDEHRRIYVFNFCCCWINVELEIVFKLIEIVHTGVAVIVIVVDAEHTLRSFNVMLNSYLRMYACMHSVHVVHQQNFYKQIIYYTNERKNWKQIYEHRLRN